jgi:hypothetical protein
LFVAHQTGIRNKRKLLAILYATTGSFLENAGQMYPQDWVVYSKRPFGGPEQVLKYLARYTHRVAISNARLLELHGTRLLAVSAEYPLRDVRGPARRRTYSAPARRHR